MPNTIEAAVEAPRAALYIIVDTFDSAGFRLSRRIENLYRPGTCKWLQSHEWWAIHNKHIVEIRTALAEEVEEYLAGSMEELKEYVAGWA